MTHDELKKLSLPDQPGVYFFVGKRKEILYIGKATSLRDRVRSYFTQDLVETRSRLIEEMVEQAKTIEYRETDSVLEALLLEANLIKTHKPRYNTREKDDKSFNYVVITNESYPRVLKVRGKELYQKFEEREIKYLFGPFPHGSQLNEALKIIRKIFPYYDTKKPVTELSDREKSRLVLNQQIGLYPRSDSKTEYAKTIQHIKLLFEGKKKQLISSLEKQMKAYAKDEAFEKAEEIKRQLFALNHIQDVSLLKREVRTPKASFRIEAYDVAHTAGTETVGVMVVWEDGELDRAGYRKFKISEEQNNDIASLKEILRRRFMHDEWTLPKLVVVDGGTAQKRAAEQILKEFAYEIPVVSVVKDDRHRPRDILGAKKYTKGHESEILQANADAHRFAIGYHRDRLRKR